MCGAVCCWLGLAWLGLQCMWDKIGASELQGKQELSHTALVTGFNQGGLRLMKDQRLHGKDSNMQFAHHECSSVLGAMAVTSFISYVLHTLYIF